MKSSRQRAQILVLATVVTLVTAACDLATLADITLEESDSSSSILEGLRPVAGSEDPTEASVAVARKAISDINDANQLLEDGLSDRDVGSIDKAIKLRPDDPYYDYQKAALQLATIDLNAPEEANQAATAAVNGALNSAWGKVQAANPDASLEEKEAEHNRLFGAALIRAMDLHPRDSEMWDMLRGVYCKTTGTKLDVTGFIGGAAKPPCFDQ